MKNLFLLLASFLILSCSENEKNLELKNVDLNKNKSSFSY